MSAPTPDPRASTSTAGFADGLGRRTLVFDRQCGTTAERLFLRPELAAFEEALRERVTRVAPFDDERFARVREISREPDSRSLVVVSEFVPGDRLSHLLEDAAALSGDDSAAPGIDVGIGFLLQVLPALSALHGIAGITHGALSPGTMMVTPAGQVVLADYIYAQVLQRVHFTRTRLWHEFRVAMPPGAGAPRFDVAADLGQAALSAVMLSLGRPLARGDYPNRLAAALMEVAEIAQIRANAAFADNLRRLFERLLPLPGRRPYGSADDACDDLTSIARAVMGVDACRNAFPAFVAEMAAATAAQRPLAEELQAADFPIRVRTGLTPVLASAPPGLTPIPPGRGDEHETIEPDADDAPRVDVHGDEPPQVVPAPLEVPSIDVPSIPPVVIARREVEKSAATPEPAAARPSPPVERAPEPVVASTVVTPAASVAASTPPAAPEPIVPSTPASSPLPVVEPSAAATARAAAPLEPAAEPEAAEAPEVAPSRRRRRGRGVRDRLRSLRAPAPKPPLPAPPPAPPPPPVRPLPPPVPVVAAPPPRPLFVPPPPAPPSPYMQATHAQHWQPSPATIPLAPATIPLAPATVPMAPAAVVKPVIPLSSSQTTGTSTVRIKSEPPKGYSPKHEPRVSRIEEHIAPPYIPLGSRGDMSRFGWKRIAAAVVILTAGLAAGRAYLTDQPVESRHATPAGSVPAAAATPPPVARTGTVVLETQPSGARVLLDGEAAGETPLTLNDVAPGRHVLTFVTASATVKRAVRVEAGKTLALDVPVYSGFVAVFAPIVLHVSEGGRAIGSTEQGPIMLSPGRHQLTLSNRQLGYTAVETVEVEPGEEYKLTVDPRGAVNLNAVPWAEVFVDGVRAGETPIANLQVPLGTREFVFKHPQFGERRITTTVTGTAPAALSVDFTKSSRP